jgi:hypothetical protein
VGRLLREAGATVELHDDHFPQTELDKNWIPNVTARGWVILTKDKNIRRPSGEREDVLLAGARVFTLTSGNMRGSDMATVFIQHLSEIEQIASTQTPPFVYVVGPGVLQQILPEKTPPQEDQPEEDEETPDES